MQTQQTFFKFLWKLKISSFYYQNFSDTCLITSLLSFALINGSTWYLWSRKISANEEGFRQVSLNNERATVLLLMDTETSNLLVRLHFYGDFQKAVLNCENMY